MNNIGKKIIDFQMQYVLDNSNYFIRQYHNQINIYERKIEMLKDNKPFSFQKKKLKEYNDLVNYYTKKIRDLNLKIEDETSFIINTYKNN